jgi:hypothetical protein
MARIDKSIRGMEQAPSSRQQLGSFTNWRSVQNALGQPFNNERIPLSKLKLMRRDPMLAFGMHYQKMPKVKAPWYMESSDAQVAAFMDGALRPIIASLIIAEEQKKDFGFQAIGKRFQLAAPQGMYLDPQSGQEKPAWDTTGGIQPITLKPFVALPPEGVEPMFDEATGEFAGIKYKPPQGSSPVGQKAKGPGGSNGEVELDIYHCQPAGELVLTFNRGYVPIEDLDQDNDLLVVWEKQGKKIRRSKGFAFKKVVRSYYGDLLRIFTEAASTRVTPNHKFTVRWTPEAQKKWAVYLMRKGSWWRIGITPLIKNTEKKASGIGQRVSAEGADAAWILDLFDSKNEALYHEKLWQNEYRVPGLCFRATDQGRSEHCLMTGQMEEIWNNTDSESGALDLLEEKKRCIDYPFFEPAGEGKTVARGLRGWTCHAANLVAGSMEIPRDPGSGQTADWEMIETIHLFREEHKGEVYSIDVPPHHHYVTTGGIITQNSLWVTNEIESVFGNMFGYPRLGYAYPYWWSYWFRWAIADRAFEKKGDPPVVVRHPEGEIDLGNGETIPNQDYALLMAERLRAGAAIALPSNPYTNFEDRPGQVREWDIEYLKGGVEMEAFDSSFDYMDVMKLRAIFVPEQALIEGGGGTSSRNVAEEMFSGLVEGQTMDMEEIVESINRWIIPHLMMVNFPDQYAQGITCRMKVQGFSSTDTELLSQVIQLIGQEDAAKLGIDVRAALKQLGIPLLSEADYQIELKAAAEKAAKEGPPEVAPGATTAGVVPTRGKRPSTSSNTGVTKTGGSFTGFTYVSPVGLGIELSATTEAAASFISALPPSPHYEDATMRSFTKRLWNAMEKFYAQQYREFQQHVEEQEAIQLSAEEIEQIKVELSSEESEEEIELAIGDMARTIGRKVVNSWPGNLDLIDETSGVLTDILERMVTRASELARKKAGLEKRMSDDEIKNWVSVHISDLVPNSLRSIREELSEFVGKAFDENEGQVTPEDLSKAVEAHYSDFPKWLSSRFSRAETRDAFNAATLLTGRDNGLDVAQAMDALSGNTDRHCEERDGQFFPIDQALLEEEHPGGTLAWRLVKEPVTLARVDEVPNAPPGSLGTFDAETNTIFLSTSADREDERKFLLAIGDKLAA